MGKTPVIYYTKYCKSKGSELSQRANSRSPAVPKKCYFARGNLLFGEHFWRIGRKLTLARSWRSCDGRNEQGDIYNKFSLFKTTKWG